MSKIKFPEHEGWYWLFDKSHYISFKPIPVEAFRVKDDTEAFLIQRDVGEILVRCNRFKFGLGKNDRYAVENVEFIGPIEVPNINED